MSEHEEQESTDILQVVNTGQLARVEIDMQISTAKSYPRSLSSFKATALKMATLDEETAASCFYSLPRAGKQIVGPSARLAEIVAVAWKNLRFGARIVAADDKMLTAQGVCHDLESNIAITFEVQRRITDKRGKRFNDDMIVVTGNAASSIALRNAVLKVVPKAYWGPVFDAARQTAVGTQKTLASKRIQGIEYLAKMGVAQEKVLGVLGRKTVEEIDLEDLETLRGLITAIKDGDTTIEEAFAPPGPTAADKVKEKLKEKLNGSHKAETAVETPKEQPKEAPKEAASEPRKARKARKPSIDAIREECKKYGEPVEELLALYKVEMLEDLTQEQSDEALSRLRQEPTAAEGGAKNRPF